MNAKEANLEDLLSRYYEGTGAATAVINFPGEGLSFYDLSDLFNFAMVLDLAVETGFAERPDWNSQPWSSIAFVGRDPRFRAHCHTFVERRFDAEELLTRLFSESAPQRVETDCPEVPLSTLFRLFDLDAEFLEKTQTRSYQNFLWWDHKEREEAETDHFLALLRHPEQVANCFLIDPEIASSRDARVITFFGLLDICCAIRDLLTVTQEYTVWQFVRRRYRLWIRSYAASSLYLGIWHVEAGINNLKDPQLIRAIQQWVRSTRDAVEVVSGISHHEAEHQTPLVKDSPAMEHQTSVFQDSPIAGESGKSKGTSPSALEGVQHWLDDDNQQFESA